MKTLDEMTVWRWCHTGNGIFLHILLCKSHIPVLQRGSWAKCSQPAGPPMHWQAPSLGDAWPSSKTQDNQRYVHRRLWAGSHLRWRQTFPTNDRKQIWQEWRCCLKTFFFFFWLFSSKWKGTAKPTTHWHNCIRVHSLPIKHCVAALSNCIKQTHLLIASHTMIRYLTHVAREPFSSCYGCKRNLQVNLGFADRIPFRLGH